MSRGRRTLQEPEPHISNLRLFAYALLSQVGEETFKAVQDEGFWTAQIDRLGDESNAKRSRCRLEPRGQDHVAATDSAEIPFPLPQCLIFEVEITGHGCHAGLGLLVEGTGHFVTAASDKVNPDSRCGVALVFTSLERDRKFRGEPRNLKETSLRFRVAGGGFRERPSLDKEVMTRRLTLVPSSFSLPTFGTTPVLQSRGFLRGYRPKNTGTDA